MSTTKPTCAVHGALHGGRAMCGAIGVSSNACHSKRACEHQRKPEREPDTRTCISCGAVVVTDADGNIPDGGLPCGH